MQNSNDSDSNKATISRYSLPNSLKQCKKKKKRSKHVSREHDRTLTKLLGHCWHTHNPARSFFLFSTVYLRLNAVDSPPRSLQLLSCPQSLLMGWGRVERGLTLLSLSRLFSPLPAQHVKFIVGRNMQQRKELPNRDAVSLISLLVWRIASSSVWQLQLGRGSGFERSQDRARFFMTLAQRERVCQSLLVSANRALPCLL